MGRCGQAIFRHVVLGIGHRVKALVKQGILVEYPFLLSQFHPILLQIHPTGPEFIALKILSQVQSQVQSVTILQLHH